MTMWHPTARLRWKKVRVLHSSPEFMLQQQWVRMDFNPEIAEGMPHEGAREWRDVPTESERDNPLAPHEPTPKLTTSGPVR
jgi:hypothetical protein